MANFSADEYFLDVGYVFTVCLKEKFSALVSGGPSLSMDLKTRNSRITTIIAIQLTDD